MNLVELFPENYFDGAKLDDVVDVIRYMPVPQKYKKYIIVEWCKEVGVPLTKEIVERAGVFEVV